MLEYLKEIRFLLGDKYKDFPWMIGLFLTSSMLDLIGLGLVVPYIILILNPDSLGATYIGGILESFSSSLERNELILIMSLALLVVFFTKTTSAIFINKKIIKFSLNLQMGLKSLLMNSYQNMEYTEYLRRNSSEYITSINNFTSQFANGVVQNMLKILCEGITLFVIVMILAINNGPALALLFFLITSVGFGYDRFYRRRIKEYAKQSNKHDIRMVQGINEGIEGLKEIRILGCEDYFHKFVVDNANQYAIYSSKTQIIRLVPRYLLELMLVVFIVLLVVGTILSGQDVNILLPTLSLFGMASIRLIPSTNILLTGLSFLRSGRDATSRLYCDVLKMTRYTKSVKNSNHSSSCSEPFQSLTFEHVSFHYSESLKNSLEDLTLTINKGDSIGLVGTSGSGKTTLVDTMLGLLEPQKGVIKLNNKPLNEMLVNWRENVAYLPQQVLLTDSTLRCNVALGVPENEINEQKLFSAIEQARLSELVKQLPDGVDTVIGERGARISGGQRQRVALARAFYHERSVLIMDEATSALDNETEKEIVEEIKRLKGQKTLIVIAHRLTTVEHCDRIYRLEDGEIVEEGSYASVIGV